MAKLASFNTNSLSAVSDYFGQVDDKNSKDEVTHHPKQNDRVGVGGIMVQKQKRTLQFMVVGKDKKLKEEDIQDVISDEEEDGRTAITAHTANTRSRKLNHDETFSKKKKKKDKKRRLKEASNKSKEESISLRQSEEVVKEAEAKDDDSEKKEAKEDEAPKKRQRVKRRSRQKNIRKDTRPLEARPAHLQLGNRNYTGRPLTDETRAKLKIPKRTKIKKNPKICTEDFSNTRLAIDDFVDDSYNKIVEEPTPEKSVKSTLDVMKEQRAKVPKRKRKAKYKNLI
mmetsp:Transcript_3044/g.4612  ORF Transcript_3044/g.4612 Transcript_3044/m.4612 type:complete len:283 (+) Transcript_3044:157-1005(+)